MALWLYLHFPNLQLDKLFCDHQQTPLAVVDPQTHRLVQINQAAKQQGLTPGAGLGSAAAICHELQVHPYDPEIEEHALLEIAQWLYNVTSDISLFPPQGLLLNVTNMLSLYGGLTSYWQTIERHLQHLQLGYQYSTGFSPLAAIMLAKSNKNHITDDKSQLLHWIQQHPLTASELEEKHIESLQRIGIETIQQLLALPMPELARRFDIDLVNYVGRLLGQFKHPVEYYHPPQSFSRHLILLFDIENIQWLEKPLSRLLHQLEAFLKLRDQVAYELQLTLHQRDNTTSQVYFTSASGDYLASAWLRLCQLTMESLILDAPVQELTLSVLRAAERDSLDTDLFAGQQGRQTSLELISALQAKLGRQRVQKVLYTDDPRPEHNHRLCEPTQKMPAIEKHTALRPCFIYDTPRPLHNKVRLIHGPERLLTGWWDNDEITRDYFIARSDQGQWLWVFRTPQQQWFVHGQFS